MPILKVVVHPHTGHARVRLNVPAKVSNTREAARVLAVQFANWFVDRFFTGFVWGFAFMLGLWVFGTLVGLR